MWHDRDNIAFGFFHECIHFIFGGEVRGRWKHRRREKNIWQKRTSKENNKMRLSWWSCGGDVKQMSTRHVPVHQWRGNSCVACQDSVGPGEKMTSILWELLKMAALLQLVCDLDVAQRRFSTSSPSGFRVHHEQCLCVYVCVCVCECVFMCSVDESLRQQANEDRAAICLVL